MFKVAKYIFLDILRSKIIIAYAAFLMLLALGLFYFEEDISKSISSLTTIVLIIVPLVCIIFTTIYFYNSSEFILLLMAQPISRKTIFTGLYMGVALAMLCAFIIGIGVPILLFAIHSMGGVTLFLSGTALSLAFVSLAFLSSVLSRDKAKGIGFSLMIWFYFSIIYDAIILVILYSFQDYPLEKAVMILSSLNPIDLSRILIFLKLDISALMGFTGALYKDFFGTSWGFLATLCIQILWIFFPAYFSFNIFKHKNW